MPRAIAQPIAPVSRPMIPHKASDVMAILRSREESRRKAFQEAQARFSGAVADTLRVDITYCLGSRLEALAIAQAEAAVWAEAVGILEEPQVAPTFLGRLEVVARMASEFADHLLDRAPWEQHSTSQVSNILERAKLTGRSRAWAEIKHYPNGYLGPAPRYPLVDDIAPVAAAEPAGNLQGPA